MKAPIIKSTKTPRHLTIRIVKITTLTSPVSAESVLSMTQSPTWLKTPYGYYGHKVCGKFKID